MTEPTNFETFMRAYQNMVFSTAVRLLGNDAEVIDDDEGAREAVEDWLYWSKKGYQF